MDSLSASYAVLLTCFNRIDLTVSCLSSIKDFFPSVDIYLVDDGSTDGTSEIVMKLFPKVILIQGNGKLFWNRGMHLAWSQASNTKIYDFFIWLNNDVIIYDSCFLELLECSKLCSHRSIIAGIIESTDKSKILYGGSDSNKKLINPNGELQHITYLNGNVVLVPRFVFNKLGNLDPRLHHDLGDVDYGLRAKAAAIGIYTTRIPIASGTYNSICRIRENNVSLYKRFKKVYSPLGSNPFTNFYFRNKHIGFLHAMMFFIFQHFLILIPDWLNMMIFNKKYV